MKYKLRSCPRHPEGSTNWYTTESSGPAVRSNCPLKYLTPKLDPSLKGSTPAPVDTALIIRSSSLSFSTTSFLLTMPMLLPLQSMAHTCPLGSPPVKTIRVVPSSTRPANSEVRRGSSRRTGSGLCGARWMQSLTLALALTGQMMVPVTVDVELLEKYWRKR